MSSLKRSLKNKNGIGYSLHINIYLFKEKIVKIKRNFLEHIIFLLGCVSMKLERYSFAMKRI